MRTKIIHEDAHIIVVHKPAGLATQTAHVGQQDVVSELKNYLAKSVISTGRASYLGVVHRLDQPVEGLLVFAKTKEAAARLTAQLSGGTLNKQYYAMVCGKPAQKTGKLVDYLVKEGNSARVGSPQEEGAKQAILQYKVIKQVDADISLLDVHIETGRFHQIRLQLAHAGYPILGDLKYGSKASAELSGVHGIRNVALYAYHMKLVHPITGKKLDFTIQPEFFYEKCSILS